MASLGKRAFVFAGQGSQRVGMFSGNCIDHVRTAAKEVSETIGIDLIAISEDAELVDLTINAQPALLAAGVGSYRSWIDAGGEKPACYAGHSLGEYCALVCAGAISFTDAAKVVHARALAMQDAVPQGAGAMYAVLGLDVDKVAEACTGYRDSCWITNINSPMQIVIAGISDCVEIVSKKCTEFGAKRVVQLAVSVPSHCPLLAPAQDALKAALADIEIKELEAPVFHNATSEVAKDADEIKHNLVEQLVQKVDWVSCVKNLAKNALDIVECGGVGVLTGLNRRIIDSKKCLNLSALKADEK